MKSCLLALGVAVFALPRCHARFDQASQDNATALDGGGDAQSQLVASSAAPDSRDDDSILERSKHALGLAVAMQFFSYLPYRTTPPSPRAGWNETRLDTLKQYLDETVWAHTNHAPGKGLSIKGITEVFYNDEVTQWVDYKGKKQGAQDEREFQKKALALEQGSNVKLAHLRLQGKDTDGVYAVLVDDDARRVTLAFRGSQFAGTGYLDLVNNFRFFSKPLKIDGKPVLTFDNKTVRVHGGYGKVLFRNLTSDGKKGLTSPLYTSIKGALERNFGSDIDGTWTSARHRNKGKYSLTVTGHSLGGSLATLAGFALARDPDVREWFDIDKHRPVEILAFANPPAGDKNFVRAFEDLEGQGAIRSVTLRASDDVVPNLHRMIPGIWRLKPVGSFITLEDSGVKEGSLYIRHLGAGQYWKWKPTFKINLQKHATHVYARRVMKAISQDKKKMTLKQAYAMFFKDGKKDPKNEKVPLE